MIADSPVFISYVRSDYLYNHTEGQGYFTQATVFAVSSITNESLKAQIIVDDKTMFANIPICALANNKMAPVLLEEDCVYSLCSDDKITVFRYEYLLSIDCCSIWKKDKTYWQRGSYIFTVEWDKTKQQLHFIELEDGNYVLWANERITWGEDVPNELPAYGSI